MSRLGRLPRSLARRLPAPVKAALRRRLPASLVEMPRRFTLEVPAPPTGLGPSVRPAPSPAHIAVEAPRSSYVPRLLEERGLRGYEPETMAAYLAAISWTGAADAFDVGANVGVFSIMASALTTARVTAFEPTPALVETFRRIARRNGLACEVQPIALGSAPGTATLYLSARTDSSNSLRAGYRPALAEVTVPVERLDDVIVRLGRRPSVMKLDTETTEPEVLAGATGMLRDVRPMIVCEVLAGQTEAGLEAALRPYGYRFHHLGPAMRVEAAEAIVGDPTWTHRDWLFTPEPLDERFQEHYAAWRRALSPDAPRGGR